MSKLLAVIVTIAAFAYLGSITAAAGASALHAGIDRTAAACDQQ